MASREDNDGGSSASESEHQHALEVRLISHFPNERALRD